jgi:toxin-antitoxin system PIN domain toxin
MPVHLLDVNLLVALGWANHVHHAAAHASFAANAEAGWATCPMTECGFIRISANPRAIAEAVPPIEAVRLLDGLANHPHHVFWKDELPAKGVESLRSGVAAGHQQVTDAYLVALAGHHGGRFATFDRAARALAPAEDPDRVALVIP